MIINTLIDGRHYAFNTEDASRTIGQGGEAIVMRWTPHAGFTAKFGSGKYAVKLFFRTTPEQRHSVERRGIELRGFPRGLRRNAVSPLATVTDSSGNFIGIVLPFIEDTVPLSKLMDPDFIDDNRVSKMKLVKILLNLGDLMTSIHKAGVVIGDFNDKNVLVRLATDEVFLIDMDSAQWGSRECRVAIADFADPRLLGEDLLLRDDAKFSQVSDVYSYTVMVYQLLTLSNPYRDGVHKPKRTPGKPWAPVEAFSERIARRLTVFDPSIKLPSKMVHPASLPEELGLFMRATFVPDGNGNMARTQTFPFHLLTSFRWMTCPKCRREHGRAQCPNQKCGAPGFGSAQSGNRPRPAPQAAPPPPPTAPAPSAQPAPTAPAEDTTYLAVANAGGRLKYVCHSSGAYRNETGAAILHAPVHQSGVSVLVAGQRTVFLTGNEFAIVNGDPRLAKTYKFQKVNNRPAVAANSHHTYWVSGNSLVHDGPGEPVTIGPVVQNLTSVWAGERFGVALVQAGVLLRALVFDAKRPGLKGFYLPPLGNAKVIDAHCAISGTLAWLTVVTQTPDGQVTNTCYALNAHGELQAIARAPAGASSWLGTLSRAALAVNDKLLVPLPRTGIACIGVSGVTLHQESILRSAAGAITSHAATVGLALTAQGLVHVGTKRITTVTS